MFDPTKPVQTRDGRPARIIANDRRTVNPGRLPIVALVRSLGGRDFETVYSYSPQGLINPLSGIQDDADLVNIPEETREFRTVRIHEDGDVTVGGYRGSDYESTARFLDDRWESWDGVMEYMRRDGVVTSVKFYPKGSEERPA